LAPILGAAIENFVLAARAFGLSADVVTFPIPAAQVELTPTPAARDALFAAIPNRHTNRGPYLTDHSISNESLHRFTNLVTSDAVRVVFVEDKHARSELGAMIVEARSPAIRKCPPTALAGSAPAGVTSMLIVMA
jgi:hypothetical protein